MESPTAQAAPSTQSEPLLSGGKLRCPRCKRYQDPLRFERFDQIEEYEDETNPIVKCPVCRWIFSPGPSNAELAAMLQALFERSRVRNHLPRTRRGARAA